MYEDGRCLLLDCTCTEMWIIAKFYYKTLRTNNKIKLFSRESASKAPQAADARRPSARACVCVCLSNSFNTLFSQLIHHVSRIITYLWTHYLIATLVLRGREVLQVHKSLCAPECFRSPPGTIVDMLLPYFWLKHNAGLMSGLHLWSVSI